MRNIDSLNGFRAVSVFMVIGSHLALSGTAPDTLSQGLSLLDGTLGVRVFFCISGFLITLLLLDERKQNETISLKQFYARRIIRIVPVNYVFIFVLFLLTQLTQLTITQCQFLTSITYTKNYACGSWVDGHLWSLSVEEQFYLIWPVIIARLTAKSSVKVALVAILLAPVSRAIEYKTGHRAFFWLTSNADALMIGSIAAIAVAYHFDEFIKRINYRASLLRIVSVLSIAAPIVLSRYLLLGWFTVTLGPTMQALGATYLICSYAFHKRGAFYAALNSRVMTFFGVLSYSLYIWQEPFFTNPAFYGLQNNIILQWPFNVVGLFLTALLSYYLLEKPLLSLRRALHPTGGNASSFSWSGGRHD
jgi:peptidoglycan/LPS O-acetylase OafA/YrhL